MHYLEVHWPRAQGGTFAAVVAVAALAAVLPGSSQEEDKGGQQGASAEQPQTNAANSQDVLWAHMQPHALGDRSGTYCIFPQENAVCPLGTPTFRPSIATGAMSRAASPGWHGLQIV
jgi:hypothetical protein